ncbi:hypothetical protein SH139x_004452 [Planctomycetaceae bacterium SH139]
MSSKAKKQTRPASQRVKKQAVRAGDAGVAVASDTPSGDAWERFWYQPQAYGMLLWTRLGISLAALLYFASYWTDIAIWFSSRGLLPTDRLGRLVASTGAEEVARWQFSLLYGIDSPALLRGFLLVGMISAVLMGLGRLGRGAIVVCWLCLLSLANRQWVVVGLVEFPLTLGLLGLTIAGSGRGQPRSQPLKAWHFGLGKRLLQVQAALLVLAIAAAQGLRGEWYSGEGFARLLTAGAGRFADLSFLAASPLLNHLAGVLMVAIPWASAAAFASGWWRGNTVWQRSAIAVLLVHLMLIAALADRWLYGVALAALLVSLSPERDK